jgi:hypothetical protein
MKYIRTFLITILLFGIQKVLLSQGFSAEIYSGTNFSNIHGQTFGGKWKSKPGTSAGLNINYSLSKVAGFQTGMNFSTVYYEHVTQQFYYPWYPAYYDISNYTPMDIIAPYYPVNSNTNFSLIRVPLLFTVSVPTTLQFTMRAGIYYSFMTGHNVNTYSYYYYGQENKVEKHDFGYIFSSGLSYPLSDKFSASFNASIITGRKPFIENYPYKHGSSEFTLGLQYMGFLKKSESHGSSDSSKRVIVTLLGGIDYSWNGGNEPNGDYNGTTGPYLGFSLKFPLGHKAFFQTGFAFERKGFSMKDSSNVFYRITDRPGIRYYADTKVQVDYAIIPALFTFSLGEKDHVFISTGPWLGMKLNARNVGTAYNDQRSTVSYQLVKTKVYDDIEEYVAKTDAGWIFAIGGNIPVLKNELEISLQYSGGFKDVFTGTNDLESPADPGLILKNRTVSLVLGIRLPYSKK